MSKNRPKVIVISGPTATGKTQLGIELGRELRQIGIKSSIINFDSLLFYRGLNIGVCKPTKEEMNDIEHFMIDVASIDRPINASDFTNMANPLIEELHDRKQVVFLVGGSGFYLQALLNGMYSSMDIPPATREKSDNLYQVEGISPFSRILQEHDPETFFRLHPNDHYRIRRAVEYFWTTGIQFSKARIEMEERKKAQSSKETQREYLHCYLDIPKENHITIIEDRTKRMIDADLEGEVRDLLCTYTGKERPLQSIGYKEMVAYLNGDIKDQKSCIERIIVSTRQLAKSQRTWFKKVPHKVCFNPLTDIQKIKQDVIRFVQKGN